MAENTKDEQTDLNILDNAAVFRLEHFLAFAGKSHHQSEHPIFTSWQCQHFGYLLLCPSRPNLKLAQKSSLFNEVLFL